jgi:uncharacterized membrane protein
MEAINLILAGELLFTGALFILISLPLLKDKIKMNRLYGIRIQKSFESEENWYKINRFGARELIKVGYTLTAAGFVVLFIDFNYNNAVIIIISLLPAIILIFPVYRILRYVKKL